MAIAIHVSCIGQGCARIILRRAGKDVTATDIGDFRQIDRANPPPFRSVMPLTHCGVGDPVITGARSPGALVVKL